MREKCQVLVLDGQVMIFIFTKHHETQKTHNIPERFIRSLAPWVSKNPRHAGKVCSYIRHHGPIKAYDVWNRLVHS